MSNSKTKSVVFDNRRWVENKNRVILFTEAFGKISVYLTGYGKPVNHWGGVFEGGNILDVALLKRRHGYIVSGWRKVFLGDDGDFLLFLIRQIILEATCEVVPFEEPNGNLFKWAVWALKNCSLFSACVYLSRLIYSGGFFDFTHSAILPILRKNFREYLSEKSEDEIISLMRYQVKSIENFIGREIRSFRIFSEEFPKAKQVF
ncbi:MAG: recombination protein O N-terminal domain-containing protein [Elusimicrobia bacterium]|nr:recombination protein O N-terminal domain-containing protein [Elusimicrobiota bacterium]